ncbi:DUF6503 family protein [Flavobacterium tegetincola]|uniref:DUF6503 family protein n=1 Tax=Flavobacterium tegetincola TaxID=150172 RepID=UPI0003FAF2EB|nr:DUF6503 family protein [Flavobacterium tegetincola]
MRIYLLLGIVSTFTILSCKENPSEKATESVVTVTEEAAPTFQNKAHQLVYDMTQKVGDYMQLRDKKDVVYTYSYKTPDGMEDVVKEQYLFDGELSYGAYQKHERTLTQYPGLIEQGYDGTTYWLKHEGVAITDAEALKKVAFNRPTNFYWFTMMQKLTDPGLQYEYIKEQKIGDATYDVVKVSFEAKDNKPTDIYQLYINKKTQLVDQFLFTVMDFGKADPLLMELEYENIEGLLLPTKRRYKASNWDAMVTAEPWIVVNWSNVKFNNGLQKADFMQ